MAERKHRHITEIGLTLLAQSGLSTSFWDDAFSTAVHIINRLPSSTLNFLSSYEKIHRKKPDYTSLKAFGCLCYPHIRPTNHHKLEFRSEAAIFLGYSPFHKGYKALLPSGKVVITRDILFDENTFPRKLSSSYSSSSSFPSLVPNLSSSPIISSSPPPFPSLPPAPQLLPIPTCSPHPSTPSPADLSHADAHVDPTPAADTSSSTHTADTADTSLPSPSHSPNSQPSTTDLSSDPPPLVAKSTSSHHMVTRSKAGVFKPKTLYLIALDPSDALFISTKYICKYTGYI